MKNDDDIIPVSIFDVYPYPDAQQGAGAPQSFLVLLKGNADERVVPITIGHFEGQALAMAMRKIAMPRPLPHDLLRQILERMGATVERLVIHKLEEDIFNKSTVEAQGIMLKVHQEGRGVCGVYCYEVGARGDSLSVQRSSKS